MKIKLNQPSKTVAQIARELQTKGKKVSLFKIAEGRGMMISSVRLGDDTTAKLLENSNEVDCVIMKNGKVLAAKGTFVDTPENAEELASMAICKIANYVKEGEKLHVDFWT